MQLTRVNPEMETGITKLESWSKSLVVDNQENRILAIDIAKQVKGRKKQIVEFFADTKDKAHQTWKAIVAQEKSFTDRLDSVERLTKQAIITYDNEVERQRQEERARLQAEADKKARVERERLEKAAEKLKTPELKEQRLEEAAEIIAPVVQMAEPEKVKGTRTTWKHRVMNVDELDRQYMIPNDKMLDGIARSTKGNIKIAGVEFYPVKSLNVGA